VGTFRGILIGWASLALAAVQAICAAAVALSGVRVLLGMTSLLAAGAVGPAQGFHRNALRIPILTIAGMLAALNLLLLWNENRIRRNPAAQWRTLPLTSRQRRGRWIQLATSVATLLLILAEVGTHAWFHIEH
jgi:ABC-type xylose transport system permease subunit